MEEQKRGLFIDLNETLYLEHGQEIDEMIAISLDPDITLQMYEEYIQIRGIVMLQGEYYKYESGHAESTPKGEQAVFMEKVLDKNARESKFSHRFPLDISIPNERVKNVREIEITIDAFDYELPDVQTLKLEARLHIHGVRGLPLEVDDDTEQEEIIEEDTVESTETVAETDEKVSANSSEKNTPKEDIDETIDKDAETVVDNLEINDVEKEVQSVVDIQETTTDLPSPQSDTITRETEPVEEMHIQYGEAIEEGDEEEVQDVQFLTELFDNDEEEMAATIKLYIIQAEDTIESIAKKYEVPTLELMKQNQLNGEEIYEGQIIHIPK